MPSDRLLAKLAAKNKQAPSNDGNTPRAEASNSKPLSNASSPPVHTKLKRTSSGQDTHNAQQTSSVKRLKIEPLAPGPTPPSRETSDKVNPVIVEIEPHARWTAGVSPPMQALDVFDLPADADAYINESPTELLNRTRLHFGRFAADFVHVTKLFGLNNFEESYQKLIEENTVLKNVQQESKTRIEQLQSEIASFEKQRQRWETDRLKLKTDNKRLSWDKSTLSSKVTELLSKLTALEAEHQQATNIITALKLELNQVDEKSMNDLKEGYTACLDKFRAAGIDITGKTYQAYLNEITAKTTQTASNVLAPEIASNVAQAHLYTVIKVARDKDLMEQIGKNIYFDLVDHDKVRSFRIQKHISFNSFKEEVAKEFGVPVEFQRFWIWAKRKNHTYRPDRPLTQQEEAQSVGQFRKLSYVIHNALKLFLEIETGKDQQPISPPDKSKEDILLFFKLYDPKKEELRYVGRLFVKNTGKPIEILTKLNEMAGFDADEEIELFEEVKFEPCVLCERLDKRASFRFSQIEDGDIICFQKYPHPQNEEEYRYPDVPSYMEYVKNRQIVHFRSLEKPNKDDFCLELSKLHTYDDVVERVAQKLGLKDPSKIRLTPHNCYSQQPKLHSIKYRVAEHLLDMLVDYNQISDILYYEVLDIPLPELQCLKTLKVAFHHATKDEVVIHNIRLPKQSNVGDVLNEIKTKVELSHSNAELRLLEVFYHKIHQICPLNEKIKNSYDQNWTLRAEEIPEEEKNLGPHDCLIHVYHIKRETAQNQMQVENFGEPFFLVIHEGETLAQVKTRIQKKLHVSDEEFTKWKFAFVLLERPEYLLDSDIVSSRFQRGDVYCAWEQYLGLEHSDTTPKRAFNANQNWGPQGRLSSSNRPSQQNYTPQAPSQHPGAYRASAGPNISGQNLHQQQFTGQSRPSQQINTPSTPSQHPGAYRASTGSTISGQSLNQQQSTGQRYSHIRSQSPGMGRSFSHLPPTQTHQGVMLHRVPSGPFVGQQQEPFRSSAPRARTQIQPYSVQMKTSSIPSNVDTNRPLTTNTEGTVQPLTRPEGIVSPSAADQDWRPTGRMRGSLSGQAYSDALNLYFSQPTQPILPNRPLANVITSPSDNLSPLHVPRANSMNNNATQETTHSSMQPANTAGNFEAGQHQTE